MRDILENPLTIVVDGRCLAVHQTRRPVHFAAVDGAETLVPETDAEHGDLSGEVFDSSRRNAPILDRFARTRRDDEMVRLEGDQLVQRDLVVAEDADLRAQLTQILDKVVVKES